MIIYEYPFSERIRTYLRLEHLFQRLAVLEAREDAIDHHFAIATLFEIMDVGDRADLKSDVLRDLEKQKQILNSYRGNPAIAQGVLDEVLGQIERCYSELNSTVGKVGSTLTENDALMSIRSRVRIPGGTCEFDLPAYYAWQHESATHRRTDLQRWTSTLTPVIEAIHLLLQLLRDSGAPQKVAAIEGKFEKKLPQDRTFQLLRLAIDPALGLFPEISANRLMVSIRLLRLDASTNRQIASSEDASFELTYCL